MSGHDDRMTCCDFDCALVNNCRLGGVECDGCGRFFCAYEINADGYCAECAEDRRETDDDDEDGEDGEGSED